MMMTVSNYRSRNCITTLLQHSRSSNFSQEIVLFPRDPPRQKKHNLLLFVLVLNDLVLCCCVMLTNLWPSKESTECHCKCICPPITAARCLNLGKIGENRNSRSLAEELSVGSVAQLHHSDSTEYSRLSICHPLTSAPLPSSFSNFLVKLSDHRRSLAHSPAHESRSQFVDTPKPPQPDPNRAI